jgi:formylglycine-generating enzyme required for sulfatase activity
VSAVQQAPPAAAPARAAAPAATPLTPIKVEYVKIPAGEFMMGCSNDPMCDMHDPMSPLKNFFADLRETPPHMVKITKPFEIGKYNVTQEQWVTLMGSNPSEFTVAKYPTKNYAPGNYPVENISWNQIQDFLTKINATNDGFKYRLPTEAEWEYAARAGKTGSIVGDSLDAVAWYDQKGGASTKPLGTKARMPGDFTTCRKRLATGFRTPIATTRKCRQRSEKRERRQASAPCGAWDLAAIEMRVSNRFASRRTSRTTAPDSDWYAKQSRTGRELT